MARTPASNTPARPTYVVGAQRAPRPLVSPEHVKGHLRLLKTFYNLRTTVEECKDRRIPEYAMQMDKDARWRWFVHLAVERYVPPPHSRPHAPSGVPTRLGLCQISRFEQWVKSLQFVPLEKFVMGHIPPLDVWMVWHAYLLSPW